MNSYSETMDSLILFSSIFREQIKELDLDSIITANTRADALASFLDPTGYQRVLENKQFTRINALISAIKDFNKAFDGIKELIK